MEKGAQIVTDLYEIQDVVQRYTDIISIIADVDVEVVDEHLVRIAGTGLFADVVNKDMSGEGYVYRKVLATGERSVIYQPGEEIICRDCPHFMNCKEEIEIAMPIFGGEPRRAIGVIGLVGSSREQKMTILSKEASFLAFVEQIADFISVKSQERKESARREALLGTLHTTLENIQQGTLVIGTDHSITMTNRSAQEQLEDDNLVGKKVLIEATGDTLNRYAEYRVTVGERAYHLMGSYMKIPQKIRDYEGVLIFYRSREIKNQYFETAFVPHGDKDSILGSSPATLHLKEEIERVAPSSSTVLITGESGTGKEMVATSIWREGSRKEGRFIALNCAAIPENLMESELFGYVKGAFTGADPNGRMGKFELANGGVIFLDEIGDMPLYLQSKLLRVLQERQIVRIGSNQLVDIDVRVIAATNKDLKKMVEEKQFREDLYYRLNVIPIHIEPLRNRKEDVEELSVHYIRRFSSLLGKSEPRITEDLMETLKRYPWPGNVRELENVMEYMVNLAVPGGDLDVDLLPKEMRKTPNQDAHVAASDLGIEAPIVPLVELEEAAIRRALLRYGRSGEGKLKAAQALGLSKATLYRKIKEYGV